MMYFCKEVIVLCCERRYGQHLHSANWLMYQLDWKVTPWIYNHNYLDSIHCIGWWIKWNKLMPPYDFQKKNQKMVQLLRKNNLFVGICLGIKLYKTSSDITVLWTLPCYSTLYWYNMIWYLGEGIKHIIYYLG